MDTRKTYQAPDAGGCRGTWRLDGRRRAFTRRRHGEAGTRPYSLSPPSPSSCKRSNAVCQPGKVGTETPPARVHTHGWRGVECNQKCNREGATPSHASQSDVTFVVGLGDWWIVGFLQWGRGALKGTFSWSRFPQPHVLHCWTCFSVLPTWKVHKTVSYLPNGHPQKSVSCSDTHHVRESDNSYLIV